jgi:hypothetical protein
MAVFLKVLAWAWVVMLVPMAIGAVSQGAIIALILILAALAAVIPIEWARQKRSELGLTGKRAFWTGTVVSLFAFGVFGASMPETPEQKAERQKQEAAAKIEAKAAADRTQKEAKAEEQRQAIIASEAAQKKAAERASGLHCLSAWDGSNRSMVEQVEGRLRDPDSFKHYETRIGKIDKKGEHLLIMEYGARNGFGGMNRQVAMGVVNGDTCDARVTSLGE